MASMEEFDRNPVPVDLVVIDGPNAFNMVAALLGDRPAVCSYFEEWFHFERLVSASVHVAKDPYLGHVIFHSEKGVGRAPARIGRPDAFWARQGARPNVSCMQVSIPQTQHEAYVCDTCKTSTAVPAGEKAVDVSIAVFLMETEARWNSACLVARDVDYTPVANYFRRKGKVFRILNDGRGEATALARAAQWVDKFDTKWLDEDYFAYEVLRPDGRLDQVVDVAKPGPADLIVKESWHEIEILYRTDNASLAAAIKDHVGVRHNSTNPQSRVILPRSGGSTERHRSLLERAQWWSFQSPDLVL